ncbi:MAG: hypothetical protein AVO33_08080 [delta proteobacterium ML8_F1]|nr:MAG: hypothetical protein AVO33_08080 [delta proteobacterium ML8_F1]
MSEWRISNQELLEDESLLFTGNGYIGLRANFEEGYPGDYTTIRGAYINGFYETVTMEYGESAHGFAEEAQKMLNVLDPQTIKISFDGEVFSLFEGKLLRLERRLDIEAGYAVREIDWISPRGHHLRFQIKRMASFETLELMIIDYQVTSVNYAGEVQILSTIEGDVINYTNVHDPRVGAKHAKLLYAQKSKVSGNIMSMQAATSVSKLEMAVHVTHDLDFYYVMEGQSIGGIYESRLSPGETLSFRKYVAFTDSLRHQNLDKTAEEILTQALQRGIDHWYRVQRAYLEDFWDIARVEIRGEEGVTGAVNYATYQLLASAGKDVYSNVSAKGLSGEGYEGHYFWDTEIYMIPFFTLTRPQIARNLMKFRHETLEYAKADARAMGHPVGAKIPWRTIIGKECSGYFPAGAAQYHINADVAYTFIQYYLYSGDIQFIMDYGFEVLLETARLWMLIGYFDDRERFMIDTVTGPDEYTALVNNNYYTNAMAQYHLHWTYRFSKLVTEKSPDVWEILKNRLGVGELELRKMQRASEKMFLPYSEALKISLQDDHFIYKKPWDFEGTPRDKYPLVLNFHPMIIYRHKVLKQADTVLAHFLLDNETEEVIANSYHYYEALTTHDSSLSACVHGIMASRIKDQQKAYDYFKESLYLDLKNTHGNTRDGLHIANSGGVYMGIVYGFGGLRIKADGLHLSPSKPEAWESISFSVFYREARVKITIDEAIRISVDHPVELFIDNRKYLIEDYLEVTLHDNH